jgi:hypothetical protein
MATNWNGEDARAVAAVVALRGVPAGAATLLRDALRAEADALAAELQRGVPPSAPLPKGATQDEMRAWMRADQRRRREANEALWGPYDALGEVREMAPLDAALVERLRALGAVELADKHALDAAEAMGLQHRHKTPPRTHWRTYHRDTPLLSPAGESWPPEVGEHAAMPLVGLEDVPPSATGLRAEIHPMDDDALASLPAETRARLAELSRAAWAEATQGLAPNGWDEGTVRDAVERYMRAVRALDWSKGWVPPRRLCALALALWEHGGVRARWERMGEMRQKAGRAPTLHPVIGRIVTGPLVGELQPNGGAHDLVLAAAGGTHRGWLPGVASVALADTTMGADAPEMVPLLVAWLVREVWERYQRAEREPRIVEVPASVAALKTVLGSSGAWNADTLIKALEWLSGVSLAGTPDAAGKVRDPWPLVERWSAEQRQGAFGGQAAKVFVVHVGHPLAPYALAGRLKEMRVRLPAELVFVSGALDPAAMPVVGNKQTRPRQRAALALGLPAFVMRQRTEYAERGGLRLFGAEQLGRWEKYGADEWGLYFRRSHASLPRELLEAAAGGGKAPPALPGLGLGGPILAETEPGSGLWRMADEGQHDLILEGAGVSADARRRQAIGRRKAAERAKKPRGRTPRK